MKLTKLSAAWLPGWVAVLAAGLMAPVTASAERLTLWVRDNGATLATRVIDHWNETHPADHITLTLIPHDDMMPTFAELALLPYLAVKRGY